jgi:hypothetical protein
MSVKFRTDCEGFHRRDFLKLGTTGLLGLGLADVLRLEARGAARKGKKASSVIMVWLAGGPATIDMWDLKPDAPEGIRGEFKPIPTCVPGISICEHLPKSAKVMDKCVLVRSLHHNIPEHGIGTLYMTTGNRPTPALDYPALGCLASKLLSAPAGIPSYVAFSNVRTAGPGYLGTAYSAFEVEGKPDRSPMRVQGVSLPAGFSLEDLANRDHVRNAFDVSFQAFDQANLAASLDKFHHQALDILRSDKTRKAFDLEHESAAVREDYGRAALGQAALAARRLVEAGVRFVTIGIGGWDTHARNFQNLRGSLLPQVDQALAALIADLDRRGLLDSTIVYCAGEFGRTPIINSAAGRDHWARSMAVLLAGGGLKRGQVHGATDAHGMLPVSDPCSPDDVSATIFHCLGIEPHLEIQSITGRPIRIFREGKIISAVLA